MGGWADYIFVRKDAFVYKVPDELAPEIAVMSELMTVTYNLDKAKEFYTMGGEGFGSGATVVVQGTGPMGMLHVLKAHIMGGRQDHRPRQVEVSAGPGAGIWCRPRDLRR